MKYLLTGIVALGMSASQPAMAQSAPPKLSVIVENPSASAVACGLDESTLTATLRAAMRYNQIEDAPGAPSGTPILHLSVNTLGNECITSLLVSIRDFQRASPSWSPSEEVFASTVYCFQGGTIGGRSSLVTRLNDYVKMLFDKCLSEMEGNRLR